MTGLVPPMAPSERTWLLPMGRATETILRSAPPTVEESTLRAACAEEWVRSCDAMLRDSAPVTRSLVRLRELHVASTIVGSDGLVRLV